MKALPILTEPRPAPRQTMWILALFWLVAFSAACQPFTERLRGQLMGAWVEDTSEPDVEEVVGLPLIPDGKDSETDADDTGRLNNNRAPARRADYVLMGVDCFGASSSGDCDTFSRIAGLDRGQRLPMGWTGGGAAGRIQRSGAYAFVSLSPVFYPDGSAYVTIDVVSDEQSDRLKVRPPPENQILMRSNLLEVYGQFTQTWMKLFSQGIHVEAKPHAGHWQYRHETLSPYVKLFRAEVPRHRQDLMRVLLYEASPERRQAAAGLLGFDRNDTAVADALALALLDPIPSVRATAARALVPKVRRASPKGNALIRAAPVLHMLALPTTSDRSGASALLAELAQIPALRQPILETAFPVLIQMVAATSPGSRGAAVAVLETTTGLDYGTDTDRWLKLKL